MIINMVVYKCVIIFNHYQKCPIVTNNCIACMPKVCLHILITILKHHQYHPQGLLYQYLGGFCYPTFTIRYILI